LTDAFRSFAPMPNLYPSLILKKGKERSIQNFHPWIFSGAVHQQDKDLEEGSVCEIYSSDNRFLATAHFHHGSIVARILSFEQTKIDTEFFHRKIQAAFQFRKNAGLTPDAANSAFRLVHGEADYLPGLIADVYNSTVVLQAHTAGMHHSLGLICDALLACGELRCTAVFDKSAEAMKKHSGIASENKYLHGQKENDVIQENDLSFQVDWETGQKTGFYLDQRENRKLVLKYAAGRKVLNAFAYSGAFSVYALKGGAQRVDSVDSSPRAKEWTLHNIRLNFADAPHRFYESDVFEFLKNNDTDYNLMILDPPAFAKRLSAVEQATIGYRNLNYEAIRKVSRNGIIFTFSCSQAIEKKLFRKIIFTAAAQAKRQVRILHQLTQAPDHPVSVYHPEGEYLKGVVLFVE